MNNFGNFLTPEEAKAFGDKHEDEHPIEYWRNLAKQPAQRCQNCDELEWKYGQVGLCFTCTTGEADAFDDIEIVETKP